RMLSNFETQGKKLMHIVLSGQPQLAEKLASERLTQLRQRISIVARLAALTAGETRQYIEHRLHFAGAPLWEPLFSDKAYAMIAKESKGIPRNINNLCFNSMSLAFALQRPKVDSSMVQEAIDDLDLDAIASPKAPWRWHHSRSSIPARPTEPLARWRYGRGLAIGILISLVLVSIQILRSNDHILPQIRQSVFQHNASNGSEVFPIANVSAPQDAQAQNRTKEKSPRVELHRLEYSQSVESSAGGQRSKKAHVAPNNENVPFETTSQREKP